jgi:(p)ppGpp synthase/HD superfamily hydrolase
MIKDILVEFYRNASKSDYLDALKTAQKELIKLTLCKNYNFTLLQTMYKTIEIHEHAAVNKQESLDWQSKEIYHLNQKILKLTAINMETNKLLLCKDYSSEFSIKAMEYGIKCHNDTNCDYDGKPYVTHLKMVYDFAYKYRHLLPVEQIEYALAAAWTHDVIEDCRQTYNDVSKVVGNKVAEIVYALTNEKGKSRKERANDNYYRGIKENDIAHYIKICDRLANVRYSKETNSPKFEMYKAENKNFQEYLYLDKYHEMFREMQELLNI